MFAPIITLVSWNGFATGYFLATYGVKQGGVLSPVLFCVYVDELLNNARVGRFIGNIFISVFAYADDIVLLKPSPTALHKLFELCDSYAADYDMQLYAKKSNSLIFIPHSQKFIQCYISSSSSCIFQIRGNLTKMIEKFTH